jgi:hypothetical protein
MATSRWSFLLPAAGLALTAGLIGGLLLPPGRARGSPDPTPTPRRVYLPLVLKDCGPRLADCVSDILSPNPLPGGGTAPFSLSLPASRIRTGPATLGGSHGSGRHAP